MYEKTPSYYKSSEAPKRVKIANKDMKLINVGACKNIFFENDKKFCEFYSGISIIVSLQYVTMSTELSRATFTFKNTHRKS